MAGCSTTARDPELQFALIVLQIGFAPDWTKHGRAAPFKRKDDMLEILPKGVMHFPATGINDNLTDKAKKLGIPVWKYSGA